MSGNSLAIPCTGKGQPHHSEVSHAYGNKKFWLFESVVGTDGTDDPNVAVELRSKREADVAPVRLTLAPADAVRLGEALIQSGRRMQ